MSPKMSARSGLAGKKTPGPISCHFRHFFPWTGKMPKIAYFSYFPWWANRQPNWSGNGHVIFAFVIQHATANGCSLFLSNSFVQTTERSSDRGLDAKSMCPFIGPWTNIFEMVTNTVRSFIFPLLFRTLSAYWV